MDLPKCCDFYLFLDQDLKLDMQEGESYIKYIGDFINDVNKDKCYIRKFQFGYCRPGWSLSKYTTSSWSGSTLRGIG